MSSKSNVCIGSNVFPVTTVREYEIYLGRICYHGVCDDTCFLKQVRGKGALKKLAVKRLGESNDERNLRDALVASNLVDNWQIEVFWNQQGNGGCVVCPVGARPFGLARRDGQYVVENRCDQRHCPCH